MTQIDSDSPRWPEEVIKFKTNPNSPAFPSIIMHAAGKLDSKLRCWVAGCYKNFEIEDNN